MSWASIKYAEPSPEGTLSSMTLMTYFPDLSIRTDHATKDGEVADKSLSYIDESVISDEEKYDGFYAVCTDLDESVTLCANLIRCTATVIYLWKKTDFRKAKFYWPPLRLTGSILRVGLPDAAFPVISAIQNYFILLIVMEEFGMDGSVLRSYDPFQYLQDLISILDWIGRFGL